MRQFSTPAIDTLHPASRRGPNLGGIGYRSLLILATLLLAAAIFGGLVIAVAQAQEADGAITGFTLASDTPGILVVSWDTPSPEPTDYRIDWAKSGESYQSYKVEDGHLYPEGTATSVTITGLEAGAEYKVRLRARYHDGEHADRPWSGPWAEARLSVADNPPDVEVRFQQATYSVDEGSAVTVTVTLDADPERTLSIPITATGQNGASSNDYSGVPGSLTFESGATSEAFTFQATDDAEEDDGESVRIGFVALPEAVAAGIISQTTVSIRDNDGPADPTPTPEPPKAPRSAERGSEGACPGDGAAPTPVEVAVTAVPIVVASTTDDYFVLYARHDLDGAEVEIPVLVKRGEAGTTTLAESVAALPAERYQVEKYQVADPADIDGDCIDDLTELDNLGSMNPVNPAPAIDIINGAVAIPDRSAFETLAFQTLSQRFDRIEIAKFFLFDMDTDRPSVYFANTEIHVTHQSLLDAVGLEWDAGVFFGEINYYPELVAPDGSPGVYVLRDDYPYIGSFRARTYTVIAASMPLLEDNLAFHVPNYKLPYLQSILPLHRASRMNLVFDEDIEAETGFLALNPGQGYGRLQALEPDERPNPRDIVLYEALPNELPRVAGIISTVPQTPLSHVNLRAVQDGIPNAFIRDARDDPGIAPLIGNYIHYTVTEDGYSIQAATPAQVEAHYAASRPAHPQTPQRDLSVTTITPLSDVGFADWGAFGVKAANVAELGTLGFPTGRVPDGHAIPFYFYDEFMKANDLYNDIKEMLADPDFQTDFDEQADQLKKLRKKIKKGATPAWIITALEEMHATYPAGQSLRYRSSTNNEDLPGFNGAGLYDSKTQKPDETEEDGIDKSLKQVFASLWNFRAFTEREFHRIDHLTTAMGVLVHPNYTDELANGVAVSFDPVRGRDGAYYVNTQVGEDLVTNPDAHSVPEEILLNQSGSYTILWTSNQVLPGQLLLSHAQRRQLRQHLTVIHDHFKGLYNPGADEPFAMEIEFKITSDDILAIKQARPWVFGPADVIEPPVVTGVSGSEDTEFQENATSKVGRFRATVEEGVVFTWSLAATGDGEFFTIDDQGYLTFVSPPDFEAKLDADRNNVYEATILATDTAGNVGELEIKVTVTDVNEPPTVEGRTELALSENDENFDVSYSATDPEGDSTTFSWSVAGTDGGDFYMNQVGQDGVLTFRNAPDYERPADSDRNNEYLVQVRASDGQHIGTLDVTVTVTDVNEPPTLTGDSTVSYAENETRPVATYRADDLEGRTIAWSLSGDDRGDFNISQTGVLTFANIPDFEMPADANQDNEYLVTVEARHDGSPTATLDVTVTVTNSTGAEEPTITTTSNPSPYRENGTGAVDTFWARDPQGRAVSWSVTGTDSHAFEIGSSGELTFRSPPDFENPTDSGRDNRYEITVVVTDDQSLTDSVDITITVTNDAEGVEPTVSTRRPPSTYRENGTSNVYTFRASDPQRGPITWALEGDDRRDFTITRDSSGRGLLAFSTPPDFEAPSDLDSQNDYELTVVATDEDSHADRLSFTITVTDVNEGPEITRIGSAPGSVPETYDPMQVLARYTGTDPEDTSAVITRWSASGTDGGDFVMNEQGELRFRNQPDYERPADSNRDNIYVFAVRASDGRYYGSFDVTVTVNNFNEPPTITTTSSSATALRQNENVTSRLYTYRATDPEGGTISWSVSGVDGRFFAIDERGQFSFREISPPDFDQPEDSGGDNVYEATIQVRDDGFNTASLPVTVTVREVNEGPEISRAGGAPGSVPENQDPSSVLAPRYTATDPENPTAQISRWSTSGTDGGTKTS